MLHGAEAARVANAAAKATFEDGKLSADLPTVEASRAMSNADLMIAAGFASSRGDARRQIAGGAFRINGVKVDDANATVTSDGDEVEIRRGNTVKRAVFVS